MQIELKAIQQEVGITFVYVTHDQEEALTMSDRLAVFNQGRIEQVGPPAEVYEHPATEFIAGFVGVSNVLERDGRTLTVRPEKIHVLRDGEVPSDGAHVEEGVVRDVEYVGPADPVPRHARPGRRAAGARAEPREELDRGARGERGSGCGCSGAPSRSRKSIERRREGRHERSGRRYGIRGALGLLVAALADRRRRLRWGRRERSSTRRGSAPRSRRSRRRRRRRARSTSINWAGYVEKDWVTPFEQQTGCKVNSKVGAQLRRDGHADAHRQLRRRLGVG